MKLSIFGCSRLTCHRTEDNEKLREKVDEALTVYHDYAKAQGGEGQDGSADQTTANGEGEGAKA